MRSPEEWLNWLSSQRHAFLSGEEIEPPWSVYPGSEPSSAFYRQGGAEAWIDDVWFEFWRRLASGRRNEYLDRWLAPQVWREYLEQYDEYFGADTGEYLDQA